MGKILNIPDRSGPVEATQLLVPFILSGLNAVSTLHVTPYVTIVKGERSFTIACDYFLAN